MLLFLLVVYLTLDLAGYDVPYDVPHDASNFKKRNCVAAWMQKDGRDDGTRDLVLLNVSHMYIVLIGPY